MLIPFIQSPTALALVPTAVYSKQKEFTHIMTQIVDGKVTYFQDWVKGECTA